jgi:transposase-like protein
MPRKKTEKKEVYLDPEIYTKSGKLRKRRRKKSREYFTKDTEDAIVAYLKSDDPIERNKLFNEKIDYSFHKLAEFIIHTFKFYYTEMTNVEDLKHEVVAFLLDKLHHYNPEKGKAFSYFGTIAKRYLIVYNENNYKQMKIRGAMEEVDEDKKVYNELIRESDNIDLSSYMNSYVKHIDENIDNIFVNDIDKSIAQAVIQIFRRRENLEVFNKQHFYLYVREITGQNTANVTKVIKVLKSEYKKQLTVMYFDGELETDENYIY